MLLNEIADTGPKMKPFSEDDWHGWSGTTPLSPEQGRHPWIGEVNGKEAEDWWTVIIGGDEDGTDAYQLYVQYLDNDDEETFGDQFATKLIKPTAELDQVINVANILLKGLTGKGWEAGRSLINSAQFDYVNVD